MPPAMQVGNITQQLKGGKTIPPSGKLLWRSELFVLIQITSQISDTCFRMKTFAWQFRKVILVNRNNFLSKSKFSGTVDVALFLHTI